MEYSRQVPIAIVGMECLFPKASGLRRFWTNLKGGVDAITEVPSTHWKPEDYFDEDQTSPDRTYARRGGFISAVDFDPMEFGIAPNAIEATDTAQLLSLVAAQRALEDAGYGPKKEYDRRRVSVVLGVTGALELVIPLGARLGHPIWRRALKEAGVPQELAEDVVARIAERYVGWQESSFPGLLGNVVAGRVANRLDLGGTNCVVDAACASSLSAIHLGMLELAQGRSDMVVSGGVDTFNNIFMYMCFSKTPALSPTGDARPFDANADGTILGEGLGVVILKRLTDAERDGDRIYAVIRSMASSSDGKGNAIYAPCSDGQGRALREAYRLADCSTATVELIEAHGTGTRVGDRTELDGLVDVFREAKADGTWCALGSVKSQIGHTKAAAGAAGLVKAILALHHKVIPPTIKVEKPVDDLLPGRSPFYAAGEKRPWMAQPTHPRRAGVSSFGFGGSNFHCVLEEYGSSKREIDWDETVEIAALSGASREELVRALGALPTDSWEALRSAARASRARFRADAPHRLVFVLERDSDLERRCAAARTVLESAGEAPSRSTADGIACGSGGPAGPLAVLFPGQGAQYVGMLRDLACQFPQLHGMLEHADTAFRADTDAKRLSDAIYPQPVYDDDAREALEKALRATQIAQPAIGAVSLGAYRILERFGIDPQMTAGHSYGELVALCAAGKIDEHAFHGLSRLRGSLLAQGDGDRGAMLAVQAPLEEIEETVRRSHLDVVLANRNAPRQGVLSGTTAEIVRARELFSAQGLKTHRLEVSAAFHSSLVEASYRPFRDALEAVEISDGRIPVFSNSTGSLYPSAAVECRELLANQLARPVDFVSEIKSMVKAGAQTFLEVGPGRRLTGLVEAILDGRSHTAFALDASGGKRSGVTDLAITLARLAALGYPVRLGEWENTPGVATEDTAPEDASQEDGRRARLTVPICGANHVDSRSRREPVTANEPVTAKGPVTAKPASKEIRREEAPSPASLPTPSQPVPAPATDEAIGQRPTAAPPASLEHGERHAHLVALQKMQERSAQLHEQFLATHAEVQRSVRRLLEGEPPSGAIAHDVASQERLEAELSRASSEPAQAAPAPVVGPAARPTAAATEGTSRADLDACRQALFEVVAEKTGYPSEVLEGSMGLDADLGIDSIKRVEILSALQEKLPGTSVPRSEDLGTFETLEDITCFLAEGLREAAPSSTREEVTTAFAGASSTASSSAADASREAGEALLAIVAEKTGYPAEMLELDMGLDADLGIDSIKRVEILSALQERLPRLPTFASGDLGRFESLREIVAACAQATSDPSADPVPLAPEPVSRDAGSEPLRAETPASQDPGASEQLAESLLVIVAEKTGYPAEMLELDMGLDADLGIDSIKRVEILSALQERVPGMRPVDSENLGSLETLRDVVDHLCDAPPAPPTPAEIAPAAETVPTSRSTPPPAVATTVPAEPSDMSSKSSTTSETAGAPLARSCVRLRSLDSARPRSSLRAGDAIWVAGDDDALTQSVVERLRLEGLEPRILGITSPAPSNPPPNFRGLIIVPPAGDRFDDPAVKASFRLVQSMLPALENASKNGAAALLLVSRLGGTFGLDSTAPVTAPRTGALVGLAKTVQIEFPNLQVKALDLPALDLAKQRDAGELAAAVVEELMTDGPVEIGYRAGERFTVNLERHDIGVDLTPAPRPLQLGDVVVVSGGARGVTAETCVELARRSGATFLLLGRSALPEEEPEWLTGLDSEAAIKAALARRINSATGSPPAPREIEEQFRRVRAAREIDATFRRIEEAGGRVLYRALDIRDAASVRAAVDEARATGPVRGVVHGAGVLADCLILEKTAEQLDLVYDTKVLGLENLLAATAADDISLLALFSSSTARFGRRGQSDYAMANEVLNKLAQLEARRRIDCRVVSVNWGPWEGGMVTPALAGLFRREGTELIPLAAGARHLALELDAADGAVEVVVLGRSRTSEPPGKRVPDASPAASGPRPERPSHGAAVVPLEEGLSHCFERVLDLERFPFLRSHVIDRRPVLPMAMVIEWLAHGAVQRNPGLVFSGFDDLRTLKGVIIDEARPTTLRIHAGRARRDGNSWRVAAELRSRRRDGREILHARATMVLAPRHGVAPRPRLEAPAQPYNRSRAAMYTDVLFHGSDFQGIETVTGFAEEGIAAHVKTAPPPQDWISDPLRSVWLSDPLAIDCAFQLMILWSFEERGAGSLPCSAGSFRQHRQTFPRDGVDIVIAIRKHTEHNAIADIEFLDVNGDIVATITSYECVIDPSLCDAFRRNQVSQQLLP